MHHQETFDQVDKLIPTARLIIRCQRCLEVHEAAGLGRNDERCTQRLMSSQYFSWITVPKCAAAGMGAELLLWYRDFENLGRYICGYVDTYVDRRLKRGSDISSCNAT